MSQTFIQPSTETIVNVINSFRVYVNNVVLFTSAMLTVELYNADPALIRTEYMTIAGEDYQNWANNDDYIIQFVASKYGFVILPTAHA
jgi:hypothetical protein